ncbi:MAG: alanine racemase [Rhodospirillales bacterium]|nr:alanine racemase [Rhodospirillales bacterium]
MRASTSRMIVDISAIIANFEIIREMVPGSECAPVLKADAYGTGVGTVAPALFEVGAKTFFVAFLSEVEALLNVLPSNSEFRIYVLEGFTRGFEGHFRNPHVLPVLNTNDQVLRWEKFVNTFMHPFPAAVHLDTGMTRLGFLPRDFSNTFSDKKRFKFANIGMVMSHLSSADVKGATANEVQLKQFTSLTEGIEGIERSLSNSAGAFLDDRFAFDVVRPGLSLYGGNPTPWTENRMNRAIRFEARILQISEIAAGVTVGYGGKFVSTSPMRLAALGIGFADGLPRSLSCTGALIQYDEKNLPIIGRVSMDSMVVDISSLPNNCLTEGSCVEIFPHRNSINEFAEVAGTIPNEVLVHLGKRSERYYVKQ